MNRFLGKVMDERFAARGRNGNGTSQHSRSILDLAFDSYVKDYQADLDMTKLNAEFRQTVMDHIKIFMFAGHDTSSSTICYVVYELSKRPDVLAKLLREYNEVLGEDAAQTASKIKEDPHVINRMPYSLAVIKETLRLWPPGNSVRKGVPGQYIFHDGKQYPTDGMCPPKSTGS